MRKILGTVLGIAAFGLCILAPAQAATAYDMRVPFFDGEPGDDLDVPNVVDRNGCVRMCDQDLYPCDPPAYKRADGRCTRDY